MEQELTFDDPRDKQEFERLEWQRSDLFDRLRDVDLRLQSLSVKAHWPVEAIMRREG